MYHAREIFRCLCVHFSCLCSFSLPYTADIGACFVLVLSVVKKKDLNLTGPCGENLTVKHFNNNSKDAD